MRRKKKDGDSEKASSEQSKQAPLQPDFYDAQQGAVSVSEVAPTLPEPVTLPPIDDDNRWNRIDHVAPPARPASRRSALERPEPRRAAPQRAPRPAPRAVPAVESSEAAGAGSSPTGSSTEGAERSTEGRESGAGRGRRRRGRRGRGRAKPPEILVDGAPVAAPLRPGSMSDPIGGSAGPLSRRAPARAAMDSPRAAHAAVLQGQEPVDPAAPKKYKGVVVLSIGLPGSGKSSWFKRNNITPLSSDLLRGLLFDDPNEQRFQDLVFSNLRSLLRARLVARRPMNYVDATNLSPHERQGWIKLAHDYGYEVHAVFFDVPLDVCLDRNQKRQRVVADDVMRRMGSKLQAPTFEEGFTKITNVRVKKKESEDAAPSAEVVDLSAAASEVPEETGLATEALE